MGPGVVVGVACGVLCMWLISSWIGHEYGVLHLPSHLVDPFHSHRVAASGVSE